MYHQNVFRARVMRLEAFTGEQTHPPAAAGNIQAALRAYVLTKHSSGVRDCSRAAACSHLTCSAFSATLR